MQRSIALALCLAHSASAQDSHWNGTAGNNLWNNPNNWTPVGVPPPGNPTTTFTGNVWLDPSPVDGSSVMTIGAGDTEMPGVGNSTEVFNTIFGPEFGSTLNVYGTLTFDWTIAPYQPDPTPGLRSHINMYGNAYMYTSGASLNLGSGWWPVCEGTYVTMNLYNNANYSSLGGAGLWCGGHINIYDSSTFLINGYVNFDNGQANNDGTTVLNVGGGTLILPLGFNVSSVTNWIQRGILRAYGKGYDTNDLVVSDNGTNTIVTAIPLGGALQRVYFQPLVRSSVTAGNLPTGNVGRRLPRSQWSAFKLVRAWCGPGNIHRSGLYVEQPQRCHGGYQWTGDRSRDGNGDFVGLRRRVEQHEFSCHHRNPGCSESNPPLQLQ